jgi:hypothetical protein
VLKDFDLKPFAVEHTIKSKAAGIDPFQARAGETAPKALKVAVKVYTLLPASGNKLYRF